MTPRLATAILCIGVLLVCGSTLGGGFVWDDEVLITSNTKLRGADAWKSALTADFWDTTLATDARKGYWRPVIKLSQVALLRVGEGAPWPFHLVNLLLHLACVLLVQRWLRERLSVDGVGRGNEGPALIGAAIFAVHPTRYEVVGWVSCATDLFMAAFALAALWAFDRKRYVVGALLVALSMLSKESVVVLPALLLVDGWLRRRLDVRALGVAAMGVLAPFALRLGLGLSSPRVGLGDVTLAPLRVATALGLYVSRSLWPFPATVVPFELHTGEGAARFGVGLPVLGALTALGALAFVVLAWRRPGARPWLADAAWWLLGLAPFLQLLPLPTALFASDRFLYLPLLGLTAMVTRSLASWPRPAPFAVSAGAVTSYAVVLGLALPAYASPARFFEREFKLHPDSVFVTSAWVGQLQSLNAQHARRVLLLRLATQRDDLRTATWALGHLANTTLALCADDDPATLQALARFYDALLAGAPVPWELGDEHLELPARPEVLVHQAVTGMLDDVELFAATVALKQGHLDDALVRAQKLAQAPTARRLTLLARVLAARGALTEAMAVLQTPRFGSLSKSPTAAALRQALALPEAPSAQWVQVWHQLELPLREDAAIAALGVDPASLALRLRALVSRGRDDEALTLLEHGPPDEALAREVRTAIAARKSALADERALVDR